MSDAILSNHNDVSASSALLNGDGGGAAGMATGSGLEVDFPLSIAMLLLAVLSCCTCFALVCAGKTGEEGGAHYREGFRHVQADVDDDDGDGEDDRAPRRPETLVEKVSRKVMQAAEMVIEIERPAGADENDEGDVEMAEIADAFFAHVQLPSFTTMLDLRLLRLIDDQLPGYASACDWSCRFSSTQHGCDLGTLQRLASGCSPTLLLIRDTRGATLGAFVANPWRRLPRYYGSGDSFVFALRKKAELEVHHWTGANLQIMLTTSSEIAFGGGSTGFAIKLDDNLDEGSSEPCATFGNGKSLASAERFHCAAVELWSVVGAKDRTRRLSRRATM